MPLQAGYYITKGNLYPSAQHGTDFSHAYLTLQLASCSDALSLLTTEVANNILAQTADIVSIEECHASALST